MHLRFLLLITGFSLCFASAEAQKNVLKTKPLRTVGGVLIEAPIPINLTYERRLGPKVSLSLTGSYGLENTLSYVENDNLTDPTATSLHIQPEIKLYVSPKETPRGFYFNMYASYFAAEATSDFQYTYTYTYDNQEIDIPLGPYPMSSSSTYLGGGVGMGKQWIFGEHVTLDVLFLGLGAGYVNIPVTIDGTIIDKATLEARIEQESGAPQGSLDIPEEDLPTWDDVMQPMVDVFNEELGRIPLTETKLEQSSTPNQGKVTGSTFMPNFRFLNFSLGIAF